MQQRLFFNDEQEMIIQTARKFAEKEMMPVAGEMDEREEFPEGILRKMGELGFMGLLCPEEYGGSGMDTVTYAAVAEEIGRGWIAVGGAFSVHIMVEQLILKYGTEEQKSKYLPRLCSGELLGAIAMTEPGAGSDLSAIRSSAEKINDGFRLNGNKIFITTGGEADVYLVLFRTGPERSNTSVFVVEKGAAGFTFGKKERKMGYGSSPTRELIFEDCFVPAENLVGGAGKGMEIVLSSLDSGRIGVAAISVGVAQAAYEYALQYASQRVQFGRPIADFQGIQFMLADMVTGINASRLLVYQAARLRDAGLPYTCEAAMAKLFASDTAMNVTTDAVQILGGYGYMKEYPVERYMREAKMLQIVEGTNQIQRVVIARNILKK
ncbi:MAG: acyl-CoA dehydrogenase family protein [Thermoanaerobacteraceae bacterium]|nr:acyl-CoA dehydrogenase family protein [Thermoanaerobacteraceae bacterium]